MLDAVHKLLFLVLAESSLGLVPRPVLRHPSVLAHAKRREKPADQLILDRSFHHKAILQLMRKAPKKDRQEIDRLGRPDIVHLVLLSVLGTPLNLTDGLRIFIHTYDDHIIRVHPKIRLPRSHERFIGLMEQLYQEKTIASGDITLLSLEQSSMKDLAKEVHPSSIILFTKHGRESSLPKLWKSLDNLDSVMTVVGGFPRGDFSPKTMQLTDNKVSIFEKTLEAWIVAARIIYSYEQAIGLQEQTRP